MRIRVKVKPNAKLTSVKEEGGEYTVSVKVPPTEGKANEACIYALAQHFGVARSRVRIVSGTSGRRKVVEIT